MLLGNYYKIEADELNVILSQKHTVTGKVRAGRGRKSVQPVGSEYWTIVGYYSTVKVALEDMSNYSIRDTHLTDLKTVVAKVEELRGIILSLNEATLRAASTTAPKRVLSPEHLAKLQEARTKTMEMQP